MKNVRLLAGIVGALALIGIPFAYASGLWQGLPIYSGAAYCVGYSAYPTTVTSPTTSPSTPDQCSTQTPAGPATGLTGNELFPVDTTLTNYGPSSAYVPAGLAASGATDYVSWQSLVAITSVVSSSLQIPNNITNVILDPSATVASATLTMPTSPLAGQIVRISSSHTISILAIQGGGVGTISNAPTVLTASTTGDFGYTFEFLPASVATNGGATWYRLQ